MLNLQSPLCDEVSIRAATIEDLESIIALDLELERDNWDRSKYVLVFEHELQVDLIFVAGEIAGCIIYMACLDEVKILNLIISKRFRRQNLAVSLLQHAIVKAKDTFDVTYSMLEVCVHNYAAIQLYHRLGFRILCIREGYYTDQVIRDAYLMQLKLN